MFAFTYRSRPRLFLRLGCVAAILAAACGDDSTRPSDPVTSGDDVARIAILTAPTVANLGLPFPSAPIVELRDRADHAVLTPGIAVTVSISSGTLSGATTVNTDARGRAKFTDLAVDGTAGQVELRFSCCDLASARHTLSLSVREPSIQRLSPVVISGYAGDTLRPGPKVLLMDERTQPRAGATVSFEFDSATMRPAISVTTDEDGVAALPYFQFADLPSATHLSAIDVATGSSVDFTLLATVRGKVYADSTFTVIGSGDVATLPQVSVYDELLDPVAGALVRYRITSGDGALSTTEAHTDADGLTEPVTLTTSSRGTTSVEIVAVGYSAGPIRRSVMTVVPPLSFEYAGPCSPGCPASFSFTWPLVSGSAWWTMEVFFQVRVRDAIGAVPGYDITLAKDPAAPFFLVDFYDFTFRTPEEMPLSTDSTGLAFVRWELPQVAGSYSFTMSGPMIDIPWTYTATVQ